MTVYKTQASCIATVATWRENDLRKHHEHKCGSLVIPETEIALRAFETALHGIGVTRLPHPVIGAEIMRLHPDEWSAGVPETDTIMWWTSDEGRFHQHTLLCATGRDALAASMPIDWRPWWYLHTDPLKLYFWALVELAVLTDETRTVGTAWEWPVSVTVGRKLKHAAKPWVAAELEG